MYNTDHETIKDLFYQQFATLTRRTSSNFNAFDYQFSDQWIPNTSNMPL
ncbi:hypothetical protein H6503_02470 [Candidatus Woesearchaeota archaeon]|nr:hypothetical protein [Candidatus Woesearchaeota archaeon]